MSQHEADEVLDWVNHLGFFMDRTSKLAADFILVAQEEGNEETK